jgi:hypothetical protein
LTLIALVGWEEPNYSSFGDRRGKCHITRYEKLWHNAVPMKMKENSIIFGMYLAEMQEKIEDTWRISPKVVKEHEGIAKFKAYRNNIWIQSKRDPKKTWLKMEYCIIAKEFQWVIA